MVANKQQVLEQALQLSEEDRHEVISRLAESLGWDDEDLDAEFLDLCDARRARMEAGEPSLKDADSAMADLARRHGLRCE